MYRAHVVRELRLGGQALTVTALMVEESGPGGEGGGGCHSAARQVQVPVPWPPAVAAGAESAKGIFEAGV